MNLAKDSYIKLKYSIRCKKHNSLQLLKFAKKDKDKTIANKVITCTLLYKNIYFV